jgi:hypothetical protein
MHAQLLLFFLTTVGVAAIAIVAFVCIAVAILYFRKRPAGSSRTRVGLAGFGLKADLSDEQSSPKPGKVEGEGLTSHQGSIEATNELGGGVALKTSQALKDIRLTNTDRHVPDHRTDQRADHGDQVSGRQVGQQAHPKA